MIDNTKLDDVAVRKQLYEGGKAAIEASTDPLIGDAARSIRRRARFASNTTTRWTPWCGATAAPSRKSASPPRAPRSYPDATFTLRLSYGAVRGYTENGEGTAPKGTKLPYFTTIGGAYEHAAEHGTKPLTNCRDSWINAKSKVKLNTPLNVVETADIIGGNSGSPVMNRAGELVGIIFDGNIQSLPWNFVYDDTIGRSIQVDSRGILEALRNIYGANSLADELMGKALETEQSQQPGASGSKLRKSPPSSSY